MNDAQIDHARAQLREYRDAVDAAIRALDRVHELRKRTADLIRMPWPRDREPDAAA